MSEIRRVLLSRRTGLYLFIAVFLGCVFFMYDCFSEKQITLSGEELTAYIEGYPDFLKSVQDNAEDFGTITALSGGFSAKNIAGRFYTAAYKIWEKTGTIWENYSPIQCETESPAASPDFCGWSALIPITIYREFL